MSRWFRFYDNAMHDPKLLRLSDAMFRAWTTLLCFASKNDGILPTAADIAIELRCKPTMVASWIAELVSCGLLDKTSDGFTPHNWNERQYKSDSSAERMKRHRDKKRDAASDVTVTVQNRTETETETEQKDSEANASGADAPPDPAIPEREYFERGRSVLGSKSGAMIANLLKAKGRNVALARAALEEASQKQSPIEYVAAICRGPPIGKPLTEFQRKQQETNDVRSQLRNLANGGGSGGSTDRFLSANHGERPEGVRGGPSSTVLAIPGAPGRGGG